MVQVRLEVDADVEVVDWTTDTGSATNLFQAIDDNPEVGTSYITNSGDGLTFGPWPDHRYAARVQNLSVVSPLAANQRVKQARVHFRMGPSGDVAFNAGIMSLRVRDSATGQLSAEAQGTRRLIDPVASFVGGWLPRAPGTLGAWTEELVDRAELEVLAIQGSVQLTDAHVDIDINTQPVVSGVTADEFHISSRPLVTWSYSDTEGDAQVAFDARLFTQGQTLAAGFDPDTTIPVAAQVAHTPAASWRVNTDLANGGAYVAYVRAAQDLSGELWFSDWASSSPFTMDVDASEAPTLAVTADAARLRQLLAITTAANMLTDDQATFRSAASPASWTVTNANKAHTTAGLFGAHALELTTITTGVVFGWAGASPFDGAGPLAPVIVGGTYTVVAHVSAVTTSRQCRVIARYYDAAQAFHSQANGPYEAEATAPGWTKLEHTVVIPAGVAFATVQVEYGDGVSDPAAGEQHRFDGCSLHPGSSLAWTTGGAWRDGEVLVEYADLAPGPAGRGGALRNLAHPQLASGTDHTGTTDGFVPRTADEVLSDVAEQHSGQRSLRWRTLVGTAGALDIGGSDDVALPGFPPPLALAGVPGRQMTASLWARASASFSSELEVTCVDELNGAVGGGSASTGPISITTAWQRFAVTITPPAGSVLARLALINSAQVTGVDVWVDDVMWEPGSVAGEQAPGQGQAITWQPVRGSPIPAVSSVDQVYRLWDEELPAGRPRIYRASLAVTLGFGLRLISAPSSNVCSELDPDGRVWVKDPLQPHNNMQVKLRMIPLQLAERTERADLLGRSLPVVVGSGRGGMDGTWEATLHAELDAIRFERLLEAERPLLLAHPDGGGRWCRLVGERQLTPRIPRDGGVLFEGAYIEVARP